MRLVAFLGVSVLHSVMAAKAAYDWQIDEVVNISTALSNGFIVAITASYT